MIFLATVLDKGVKCPKSISLFNMFLRIYRVSAKENNNDYNAMKPLSKYHLFGPSGRVFSMEIFFIDRSFNTPL